MEELREGSGSVLIPPSVLGRALGSSSCPKGVGVGWAGVCRSLQLPLSSLYLSLLCTQPLLFPSFSSQAGFLRVGRGCWRHPGVKCCLEYQSTGSFPQAIKGNSSQKYLLLKANCRGIFLVSDQGSQEIKCQMQAVKS